jgi:hypothetical protein
MLDQECTQTHFDCADVAAEWLVNLHGGDVLKARQFLRQMDATDIFTACVDTMLAAIEDSCRASGEIMRPVGTTMCELLDAIEAHDQALNTWQRITRILRKPLNRTGYLRATCTRKRMDRERFFQRFFSARSLGK